MSVALMGMRRTAAVFWTLALAACGREAFDDTAPADDRGVVAAGNAELPYEIFGRGPDTVIMLGGGPAFPSASLRGVAARVGRHHAVVLFDGRGRGYARSVSPDSTTPGPDQDLRDLDAIVAHFALSRLTLLAHHYGALIAARYVLSHPTQVSRLALIGPMMPRAGYNFDLALMSGDSVARRRVAALYDSDLARKPKAFCEVSWGWMLSPAPELDARVIKELAPSICNAPDSVLAKRGSFKQAVLTALGAWDYRDSIAALKLPVLVLQGDRDKVLNHSAANWAYRAPRGMLLLVHGSPFFPWITDPERTAFALDAFLGGREPDGSRRPTLAEVVSPDDSLRQRSATKTAITP